MIFTGLRPGEKLYEEVLLKSEDCIPTYNDKIVVARISNVESDFKHKFENLLVSIDECDDTSIVKNMKTIVLEYISNNSIFENLDKNI